MGASSDMNTHRNSPVIQAVSQKWTLPFSGRGRQIVFGLCAAAAVCLPSMSRATVVLQDAFDYSTDAALRANWATLSENSPFMVSSSTAIAGAPFASLGNGVIQRSLLETISNFKLTIDLISSNNQARQTVGVFDASGRNGYTFAIDTNYLLIRKVSIPVDQGQTWWNYNAYASDLAAASGVTGNSGYFPPLYVTPGLVNFVPAGPTSETPMTTFTFSLGDNGAIELAANGVPIFTGSDTTFGSFSSVVIAGMDFANFNNLTVETVPEPGTSLLLGTAALGFILRRRYVGLRRGSDVR